LLDVVHADVDEEGVQTWQGFAGLVAPDAYAVPPMTHSARQAPAEQTWPAPQLEPVEAFDHAVVDELGVHAWQAFAGFTAPVPYAVPLMKQSPRHEPLTHTCPLPQLAPLLEVVQALVDELGVHTWQAFDGFTVPDEYVVPPMSQSATHAPLTQISPLAQPVPVAALDHAEVEELGVHTWQAFDGFTVPEA
jgi:hypothetical protein